MDNLMEQSMICDVDDHGEAVNDTPEVYTMLNPNTYQSTQPGRMIPPLDEHILDLLRIGPHIEDAVKQVHEDMKQVIKTQVNENIGIKRKRKDDEIDWESMRSSPRDGLNFL